MRIAPAVPVFAEGGFRRVRMLLRAWNFALAGNALELVSEGSCHRLGGAFVTQHRITRKIEDIIPLQPDIHLIEIALAAIVIGYFPIIRVNAQIIIP